MKVFIAFLAAVVVLSLRTWKTPRSPRTTVALLGGCCAIAVLLTSYSLV